MTLLGPLQTRRVGRPGGRAGRHRRTHGRKYLKPQPQTRRGVCERLATDLAVHCGADDEHEHEDHEEHGQPDAHPRVVLLAVRGGIRPVAARNAHAVRACRRRAGLDLARLARGVGGARVGPRVGPLAGAADDGRDLDKHGPRLRERRLRTRQGRSHTFSGGEAGSVATASCTRRYRSDVHGRTGPWTQRAPRTRRRANTVFRTSNNQHIAGLN